MRMSCNGCRVLRKGCSEDCSLRPCLQWIKSPESQANATLFLAKFYGRAGLINLINAGPSDLRPVFRSLLYEACGRIINPVHGSVGMMSSGNWQRCQAAVEAVLRGSPLIIRGSDDSADSSVDQVEQSVTPLKLCDIRHLSKETAAAIHRNKTRKRFRRTDAKNYDNSVAAKFIDETEAKFTITGWDCGEDNNKGFGDELGRAPSHDSVSLETMESDLVNRDEQPDWRVKPESHLSEIGLELTLGFNSLIEISDSEA